MPPAFWDKILSAVRSIIICEFLEELYELSARFFEEFVQSEAEFCEMFRAEFLELFCKCLGRVSRIFRHNYPPMLQMSANNDISGYK